MSASNRKVKTIVVISPSYVDNLLNNLKIGHYQYFIIDESVIIYNISLDDSKELCCKHNQQKLIFVNIADNNVKYEYWENDNAQLNQKYIEHEIIDTINDNNFYASILKKINCGENVLKNLIEYNNVLNNGIFDRSIDDMIEECLSDKYTGKHKYVNRSKIANN